METGQAFGLFFRRKRELSWCGFAKPVGMKGFFSVFGRLQPIELLLPADHGKVFVILVLADTLPDEPRSAGNVRIERTQIGIAGQEVLAVGHHDLSFLSSIVLPGVSSGRLFPIG